MSVMENGGPALALSGAIDIAAAGDLRAAGARATAGLTPGGRLEVDMAGVTFIDSSGLGALVAIRNAADANGCTVALVGAPPSVRRLFELTGLLESFTFVPDPE